MQGHPGQQSDPDRLYRSIEQHFISGELAEADAESARATLARESASPLWEARFRVQQAKVWVYQGRYGDALLLLKPPLPDGLPDPSLAIARNTLLSIAYRRSSDPADATRALTDAQRLCPNETSCGEVRLAQGVVAVENDRLADAAHAFELSLSSARNSGDSFLKMQSLLNLGVVSLREERYDDALDRFADASAVAKEIGARLALEKATGNVGWALYKLGDYRRALSNSQLAAQEAAALGVPVDQVEWLNDAGLSQYRLGDLSAAKSLYIRSLQLARSIQNAEETGDALVALASLSLQSRDFRDALQQSREAQRLAEERGNDSDTLRPSLIEALALAEQGESSTAREQLLRLQEKSSAKPSIQWETEDALAQLAVSSGDHTAAVLWFRRAIETFRSQRSSVSSIDSRLPFIENGASLYLTYMEYLIGQGKFEGALRILDQGRAETLVEGLRAQSTEKDAIADPITLARRQQASILVYCLRPDTSYLWAVTPSRINFFRLPGQEVILPLIDRHTRAVLSAKDVLAQPDAPGSNLYRDLVEPAESLIPPHGRVFVIADRGMYGLNFETLIASGERPHFWIEDVSIINATSLSLISGTGSTLHPGVGPGRLLVIGDPVYNRPEFQNLPHAHEEVAGVAEHFSPTRRLLLTGVDATPAAYQGSVPSNFAYIHFVTHGVGNAIDPLDSAIILSPNPGAAASYKLYARQIVDERLHADLVTISSCYGTGVASYSGEGLVGLTWAFLRAGAHNVIGALWEVNDASTSRLMSNLYDGLARGSDPAAALRAAKLSMIHGDGTFRKPFYWGPFQLYSGK